MGPQGNQWKQTVTGHLPQARKPFAFAPGRFAELRHANPPSDDRPRGVLCPADGLAEAHPPQPGTRQTTRLARDQRGAENAAGPEDAKGQIRFG